MDWLFEIEGTDRTYNLLKTTDREEVNVYRSWLAQCFERYRTFIGDSPEHFRQILAQNFHAGAWHLTILRYFDSAQMKLLSIGEHGPDIAIETPQGNHVYVEAVIATRGNPHSPDCPIDLWEEELDEALPYPDPKVQLRITNALNEKVGKIRGYLAQGVIAPGPIAIALNTGLLHRNLWIGSKNSELLRTLYALGPDSIRFDRKTFKSLGVETSDCFSISKANRSPVATNYFRSLTHVEISGVIHADCDTHNVYLRNGGDIEFVPNVYATHPLPNQWCPFPFTFEESPPPDTSSFSLTLATRNPPPLFFSQ